VIAPGDEDSLAAAVAGLLDDAERRNAVGAAGREYVQVAFSIHRLVADLDLLYGALLNPAEVRNQEAG
jgi:glycosyltransferase involved in cell wall biosynthesis